MTQVDELNKQLTGHDGNSRRVNTRPEAEPEEEPKALTVHTSPRQDVDIILLNQSAIQQLKKSMTYGVHYGPPYKNSKKDTLLKPGAEWAQKLFGIRPQYEEIEAIIQPNFDDLAKSWISFRYRCQMVEIASGLVVGEAIGSCNSLEDKYHWRKASRTCVDPNCNGDVYRSKYPDNLPEEKRGWYCKECKAKYAADDIRITGQEVGQAVNANPMDLANTLDKIAQKRAYVSAVLNATAASSIFAPGDDAIDDIDVSNIIEAEYTEAPTSPTPPPPATKQGSKPETEAPEVKYDYNELVQRTKFMHNAPAHCMNTLNVLIAEKDFLNQYAIRPEITTDYAAWIVLLYRAKSDCEFDKNTVMEILKVNRFTEWLEAGKTLEDAWNAIKNYHVKQATTPPAQPKSKKAKSEATTESTLAEPEENDVLF